MMKPAKTILLALLIFSTSTMLCGCWNYQDIERLLIVSGFAIDKTASEDEYLLTVEIVDFEMSGKDAKETSRFIEAKGDTIFDAIRNSIDVAGQRLYWAHANVVVVNQDIAREGIAAITDFISRDAEMREEMYVVISKEKTASDILKQDMLLSRPRSVNIERILSNQKRVGNSLSCQVYEIEGHLAEEGISISLPALSLKEQDGKKIAAVDGSAIFKSDKLIGFIDSTETKYLLFLKNQIKKGVLPIKEGNTTTTDNISMEIYRSETKLKPVLINKNITMNIDIKPAMAIAEIENSVNYTKGKELKKLKKDTENKIKKNIEDLIKKIQTEYGTDIFGFGITIKRQMPSVWRDAQKNQIDLFKQLKVNVNVDVEIKNSALSSRPIQKGD